MDHFAWKNWFKSMEMVIFYSQSKWRCCCFWSILYCTGEDSLNGKSPPTVMFFLYQEYFIYCALILVFDDFGCSMFIHLQYHVPCASPWRIANSYEWIKHSIHCCCIKSLIHMTTTIQNELIAAQHHSTVQHRTTTLVWVCVPNCWWKFMCASGHQAASSE